MRQGINNNPFRLAVPLLLALLWSCGGTEHTPDGPEAEERGEAEMVFTLSAEAEGSRADANADKYPLQDNELIHNYTLVFFKQKSSDGSYVEAGSFSGTLESVSRVAEVPVTLPCGTYHCVAMINRKTLNSNEYNVSAANVNRWTDGGRSVWSYQGNLNALDADSYVPMTGVADVKFTKTGSARNAYIRVSRLPAKMIFEFRNLSCQDITVRSVGLTGVEREGGSNFCPGHVRQVSRWPTDESTAALQCVCQGKQKIWSFGTSNSDYAERPVLAANSGDAGMQMRYFYVREAQKPWELRSYAEGGYENLYKSFFRIRVNFSRGSSADTNEYALLNTETIDPNQQVIVPVTFTDYEVGLDVFEYAPIGGVPHINKTEEGYDIYSFRYGNQIAVSPVVRDRVTGKVVDPRLVTFLNVTESNYTNYGPWNGEGGKPRLSADATEWIGELGGGSGTSKVEMDIAVRQSFDSDVAEIYHRTVYIQKLVP